MVTVALGATPAPPIHVDYFGRHWMCAKLPIVDMEATAEVGVPSYLVATAAIAKQA